MTKTYNNQAVQTFEVGLAIEQFLIAPFGQTFNPAVVDPGSPPSGFYFMGPVVEDSPSVVITREKYTLDTGLPRSRAYEEILGVSATISFRLYSNSFYQAQFALGNVSTITTITTIASGAVQTQYYGLSQITNYALLGVADFTNGYQVVHDFPKVSPSGDFTEEFRQAAPEMPFSFNAMSVPTTVNGCLQPVLGKRHFIATGATC